MPHNAVAVDHDGGVWRGRIQRDRNGEEYFVWKRMRSEFPADTPSEGGGGYDNERSAIP